MTPTASPMPSAADPRPAPLQVRVSDSLAAFAAHWPRSDRMGEARCHVFQCCDVLDLWLETVGRTRGTRPVFVGIFDGLGEPVMLLPLGIEASRGARILAFLDGTITDYGMPVLFPAADAIDARLWADLWPRIKAALPAYDVAVFDKMPAAFGGIRNPLMHLEPTAMGTSGHAIDLDCSLAALDERLPVRSSHRRIVRKLEREMPVRFAVARTEAEVTAFMDHLVETKSRKFDETRVPGFELPGKLAFYREAARTMALGGPVVVSGILAGETVIASQWSFVLGERFYNILSGYSDEPWRRYAPGRILNDRTVRWCHEQGYRVFDFGIGDEAYKDEYCDIVVPLYQAVEAASVMGRGNVALDALVERLRETTLWKRLRPLKWRLMRALRRGS
ncbi:GNAT family N-acetyltransferase [Methylobacterium sp. Leaf466]|uniref:GNAT family N-acetyltransferase n=1 Tax=Methylobacterium sp. Leaf466 TaxID=1736386 RepID=UPI0006F23882|nr:GNAT family N-acetyltransferase [Methylobacterium sp. Leaf466]KQT78213.1 hypothetical protein ASG59_09545 [Methylobacterium sp. Leaf466]